VSSSLTIFILINPIFKLTGKSVSWRQSLQTLRTKSMHPSSRPRSAMAQVSTSMLSKRISRSSRRVPSMSSCRLPPEALRLPTRGTTMPWSLSILNLGRSIIAVRRKHLASFLFFPVVTWFWFSCAQHPGWYPDPRSQPCTCGHW